MENQPGQEEVGGTSPDSSYNQQAGMKALTLVAHHHLPVSLEMDLEMTIHLNRKPGKARARVATKRGSAGSEGGGGGGKESWVE